MFLPKDSTIVLNHWAITRDETLFENPEEFNPERYSNHPLLAPDYAAGEWKNRDHYGYGSGRRICPGIHLAERNLIVALAKLLWAFCLEHEVDENGDVLPINTDIDTGYHHMLLHQAKEYPYKATIRSKQREETIMREFREAEVNIFSKLAG